MPWAKNGEQVSHHDDGYLKCNDYDEHNGGCWNKYDFVFLLTACIFVLAFVMLP